MNYSSKNTRPVMGFSDIAKLAIENMLSLETENAELRSQLAELSAQVCSLSKAREAS